MGQFTEAPLYNIRVKGPITFHCVKRFSVLTVLKFEREKEKERLP